MRDYDFFAFISYRSTDREWAQWLQHMLEHYRLPSVINGKELPDSLYPVFLDTSELSGGTLGNELAAALESSRYLIVVCSPSSAQSQWVDKEVQSFIDRGEIDRVIPFIIDGTPYGTGDNCFVPALTRLRGTGMEQLGISVNENGREPAAVKVIARMLGLRFNDLWKRHERDKEAERLRLVETNNRIRRNLARFVSEKALSLLKEGDGMTAMRLALEALPTPDKPDFPVTAEAEGALRRSIVCPDRSYRGFVEGITCMALHPDGSQVAFGDMTGNIRIFDTGTSRELHSLKWDGYDNPTALAFHPDGKKLVLGTMCGHIRVWDTATWQLLPLDESADHAHFDEVNSIVFSPDGRHMVTAYKAGFVIWNADNFDWVSYVDRDRDFCDCGISISPDGRHILCAGVDLSMYTLDTVQPRQVWKTRSRCRSNAVFSPDGSRIVCAFTNRIISFDPATGRRVSSYNDTVHIDHLLFSPDGSIIFGTGRGSVSYIQSDPCGDGAIGEPFHRDDGMERICAVLSCEAHHSFLFLGYNGVSGFCKLIPSPFLSGTDHIEDFIGFDDNGLAVITDYDHRAMPPEGFKVKLQKNDAKTSVTVSDATGSVIGCINDIALDIKFYGLSPDGQYIALYGDNMGGEAGGIWDVRDGVCVYIPDLELDAVENQVAFSPDGRTFVVMASYYGLYSFDFKPLDELIAEACEKCAGMKFTADERRRYYLD